MVYRTLNFVFLVLLVVTVVVAGLGTGEANSLTVEYAAQRMELNLAALDVPTLQSKLAVHGEGVRIAIIDTGVDPDHPALKATVGGSAKIVDWVDLTGRGSISDRANQRFGTQPAEGDVFLEPVPGQGDMVPTPMGDVHVGNWRSLSGTYRVGIFSLDQLSSGAFTGKGWPVDAVVVIAVDILTPEVYDVVFIDTDADLSIADESPLSPFRQRPSVTHLPLQDGSTFAVVVADLHPRGILVNLGFDGAGHGTQMAGIAAGYDPDGFYGVAPGAQVLAIKALPASGRGSWTQIAEGIRYAARQGADVISVSISSLPAGRGLGEDETQLLDQVADECECLIVLSAGNDGPGLGHTWTDAVLVVGAYYTPDMVEWDTGFRPASPGLWYFSGGKLVPSLVAPGRAPSPVPAWLAPEGYQMLEGTSAAAPQTAGVAALLVEAGRRAGLELSPAVVRGALERGATPLNGYGPAEQGFGAVKAAEAWYWLQEGARLLDIDAQLLNLDPLRLAGVHPGYQSNSSPVGQTAWELEPQHGAVDVLVKADVDWLRPDRSRLRLVPGLKRSLLVDHNYPAPERVASGWIHLEAGVGRKSLLHVLKLPLSLEPGAPIRRTGTLSPGQWQRYFIYIPEGTVNLRIGLETSPVPDEGAKGKIQLFTYRPDGSRWFAGRPLDAGDSQTFSLNRPVAGLWEFVIYSSLPSGVDEVVPASFTLTMESEGVSWPRDPLWITFNGTVSRVHRSIPVQSWLPGVELGIEGYGLGWVLPRVQQLTINARRNEPASYEFVVESGVGVIEVGAVTSPGIGLDLYLFRKGAGGRLDLISEGQQTGAHHRIVRLETPVSGTYVAWADTSSPQTAPVTFSVRFMPDGNSVHVSDMVAGDGIGGNPSVLTGNVQIERPSGRGRFYGAVAVVDRQESSTLGFIPVVVDAGVPGILLGLQASELARGQFWITATIYDEKTFRPVPGVIWLNGQPYRAPYGKISRLLSAPVGRPVDVKILPQGYAGVTASLSPRSLQPLVRNRGDSVSNFLELHRKFAQQWLNEAANRY